MTALQASSRYQCLTGSPKQDTIWAILTLVRLTSDTCTEAVTS